MRPVSNAAGTASGHGPPDGRRPMTAPMIEAEGLRKRYGETLAVAGVDLEVAAGAILGVLGPNGAGKTTTLRMLTTLALPDAGWARVAGFDVVAHPDEVRRRIGVAAQDATLDELLTGRQNLVMVGELSGLRRPAAQARAAELLEQFELADAADRVMKGYSGGMRRRLDLASSMMMRAPVLFLDEPTTGLDPASRAGVWAIIRELVAQGTTVLLTTQYLDEADQLADRVVVFDHGRVIADGTPQQLKAATGAARLELTLAGPDGGAADALAPFLDGPLHASQDRRRLRAPVRNQPGLVTSIVRALDAAAVVVDEINLHQPSLDDVFFALTGKTAEEDDGPLAVADLEGTRA
jgi:ABC-2 type transport system ATP-binding protein